MGSNVPIEVETRDSPDGGDIPNDTIDDVVTNQSQGAFEKRGDCSKRTRKKSVALEKGDEIDTDSDKQSDSFGSSKSGYNDNDDDDDDEIITRQTSVADNDAEDNRLTLNDIIELSNDLAKSDDKRRYDNMAYSDSEDDFATTKKNTKTKTIVSFVIDDVGHEEKEKKKLMAREGRRKRDLFFALVSDLSIMYGGILSLIGFALPLTEALRNEWMTTSTVGAFNVYIYVVSSAFLIYVSIYMWLSNRKLKKNKESHPIEGSEQANQEQAGVVMLRMVNPPSGRSTPGENIRQMKAITDAFSVKILSKDSGNETPFSNYEGPNSARLSDAASVSSRGRKHHPSGQSNNSDNASEANYGVRQRRSLPSQDNDGSETNSNPLMDEIYDEVMVFNSTASLGHDGASFYLRIGALFFGMANFIYVVIQIEEHFRQVESGCLDRPEVYPMFFYLIFLVVQTFYIFKNTKIHLKSHKHFARFGFAHVLATNMCNWFRILVFEVMEGMYKTGKKLQKNKTYSTSNESSYSYKDESSYSHKEALPNETSCLHLEGIYYSMAPYLFPFVLEYSLVAAATMAGMYQSLNVRVTQDILQAVKKAIFQKRHGQEMRHSQEHEEIFAKSHKGLFGGVLLLAGALIAIIMFHFALSFDKNELKALMVYYYTDIILHALLIPPVIYCAVTFSKFKFTYNRENGIDDFLLIFSMGGLVLYNVFIAFTSVSGELFYEEYNNFDADSSKIATYLNLAGAILNIIQSVLQGVFVIAGLQLCTCSAEQSKDKPGRGAIALLILGNLALWFFKTFIIKEVSLHRFVDFFGPTAWPIIMNTSLPLVLFYRFHVSVCLADMWASVYQPDSGPKYKILK